MIKDKVICIKSDCINGKPGTPGALNSVRKGEIYHIDYETDELFGSQGAPITPNSMYRICSLNKDYIGNFYKKDFIKMNTQEYRDFLINQLLSND